MEIESGTGIHVAVGSRRDIDVAEIDSLATNLAKELAQVDGIAMVSRVAPANDDPGRSKGVAEALSWGQIALSLAASGGVLVTLISAIRDWLVRQPPGTSVKLKLGSDELEVTSSSSAMAEGLVQAFIKRHGQVRSGKA